MRLRTTVAALWLAALIIGTAADVPVPRIPRAIGGYQVLTADFHVHSHPFSAALLDPLTTVIQARYEGLDAIAMTPHNHFWVANFGRWLSRRFGGPLVLPGEEITTPGFHMLAIGIEKAIDPMPAAEAVREIHRQHGVAIAAHPFRYFWPAYNAEVLGMLDGAEVVRPDSQNDPALAAQLLEFYGRAPLAAIGSSDFHGIGSIGYCRTYVFARGRTPQDVLDALRDHRTVVYDRDQIYGDPAMIQLAAASGGLPSAIPELPRPGTARAISRILALLGIALLLLTPNS